MLKNTQKNNPKKTISSKTKIDCPYCGYTHIKKTHHFSYRCLRCHKYIR